METDGNSNYFFHHEHNVSIKGQLISVFYYTICYWPDNESKVRQTKEPSHQRSATSLKVIDRPKVSFGPYEEKHRPESAKQKRKDLSKQTRHVAKGHYTPNPGKSWMPNHPQIPNFHLLGKLLLNLCFFKNIFPDESRRHGSSFTNIRPPSPRRPGLNLSDPSDPILHPPRLTYSSFNKTEGGSSPPQQEEKKKRVGT